MVANTVGPGTKRRHEYLCSLKARIVTTQNQRKTALICVIVRQRGIAVVTHSALCARHSNCLFRKVSQGWRYTRRAPIKHCTRAAVRM